jgi:hypothetical protein
VSFVAITLFVASQLVFIVVSVYFVIDSVRELLDTPSCIAAGFSPRAVRVGFVVEKAALGRVCLFSGTLVSHCQPPVLPTCLHRLLSCSKLDQPTHCHNPSP